MDDATKKRETYETDILAVLGLAASHLFQDYPAALQSRVDSLPSSEFPPGEQSLPSDGRRTRPDRLAWLTGAALWLCYRLVHLFYM
jgi:hypothetical protein